MEFSSEPNDGTIEQRVWNALTAYTDFIHAEEAEIVDILVFPESTLNNFNYPFEVPNPKDLVVVCDNDNYHEVMQRLACAAKLKKKYVVINITERSNESGSTKHYNTNVVFDRQGAVVSRYRKWNLYGELNMDITTTPDISYFATDFNVTFGHFICFDIMFSTPALRLLELGITDIVYPTMWFGQLPFLTGIQTQTMWSFRNKANFLSAGASNPSSGSTGSGIFSGKYGPLKTIMSPIPQRKLLVAEVLKSQYWNDNVADYEVPRNTHEFTAHEMLDLFLKRDNLEHYNTIEMTYSADGVVVETVCYEDTCCHFNIQVSEMPVSNNAKSYKYRLTAFDGVKSRRGTLTCALVACTDNTLASCGYRFDVGSVVEAAIKFESVVISTTFRGDTFNMPNVLDLTIMPILFDQLVYYESLPYITNG